MKSKTPSINPESMDYKQLLIKYMALVIGCEGFSFLQRVDESYIHDQTFTEEEVEELKGIEHDINNYDD